MWNLPWLELLDPGGAERHRDGPDALLRALAACQHGVVARWQLMAFGLRTDVIVRRRRTGGLVELHRGVYAVGHDRLTVRGRQLAAVLAVGPEAVLSHRGAGGLHAVRPSSGAVIDVTTTGAARRIPGVRVHLTNRLHPDDVVIIEGIPVTFLARTIVDLSGVVTAQGLDSIFAQAELLQADLADLEDTVRRARGRRGPGPARLRAARRRLEGHGVVLTRSQGEERLRQVLGDGRVPDPEVNARIGGDEFDALWPSAQVGVELDSWTYHRGRYRFVRDRAKLRRAALDGFTILPYTGFDLRQRAGVTTEIRRLLADRGVVDPQGR